VFENLSADSQEAVGVRRSRSRVTNGKKFLANVDGRSIWARRARDIAQAHVADLGGLDTVSEAERSIIRRAAAITTELERLEGVFATAGEASPDQIDLYFRGASALRRLLEAIGIERRPKDVNVTLADYVKAKATELP
jgi:hypothetical protein